jgi:hypothetical protein
MVLGFNWNSQSAACAVSISTAFYYSVLSFYPCAPRFEILAFKSDVSHWKNKKEMVGVSVRCVNPLSLSHVLQEVDQTLTALYVVLL